MNRQPFAVVVSGPNRLALAGSPETVEALLRVHSPSSILPGRWPDTSKWGTGGFEYARFAIESATLHDGIVGRR